jgi:DNA-binding transcriptional regulator/RsmH inhibitor MraZ
VSSASFMGSGASALDGKGRFALPVSFRAVLSAQSEEPGSMLVRGDAANNKCLTLFGKKAIDDYSAKAAETAAPRSAADFDQDPEGVDFWSTVRTVTIDSGGRFSLPPAFKRLFGITDGIFIVGGGRFAQLWAPERFLEVNKTNLLAIEECEMFLEELKTKRESQA